MFPHAWTSQRRRQVSLWTLAGLLPLTPAATAQQAQSAVGSASAEPAQDLITISTNNTPLDRQVLSEVLREAMGRLGLPWRLLSLPSERSLHEANAGAVDGEGLRVPGLSAQYPNLIQVPESFTSISFVAFGRVPAGGAAPRLEQGWRDLSAYRVAHIVGWKLFEASVGNTRALHKVDKPEQLFRMLESGRIDLALYTRADGLALVRSLGLGGIQVLEPALKDVDMYLYLHRRHADLVPRLAQVVRAMKADGSHGRILAALKGE
jgi:polar amino acid transport system substrate-binding protein